MLTRGPEAFLLSLYEAFDRRLKADRELLPAVLSFYGAKSAVTLWMRAIAVLAFHFFATGLSILESFYFASYYLGIGIDSKRFNIKKMRRTIAPEAVLESFTYIAPTHKFTLRRTVAPTDGML